MKLSNLFFCAAFAVAGCAWVEQITTRQALPDTRIVLAPGQHMQFSRVSRKNRQGQSLDEYRCPEKQVMVCDGAGGVSFDCARYAMQPGVDVFQ